MADSVYTLKQEIVDCIFITALLLIVITTLFLVANYAIHKQDMANCMQEADRATCETKLK